MTFPTTGKSSDGQVYYKVFIKGTLHEKGKLFGSDGFSYTLNHSSTNENVATWICAARNATMICDASICQESSLFNRNEETHIHAPNPQEYIYALIQESLKAQTDLGDSRLFETVFEEILKGNNIPDVYLDENCVASMKNYYSQIQQAKEESQGNSRSNEMLEESPSSSISMRMFSDGTTTTEATSQFLNALMKNSAQCSSLSRTTTDASSVSLEENVDESKAVKEIFNTLVESVQNLPETNYSSHEENSYTSEFPNVSDFSSLNSVGRGNNNIGAHSNPVQNNRCEKNMADVETRVTIGFSRVDIPENKFQENIPLHEMNNHSKDTNNSLGNDLGKSNIAHINSNFQCESDPSNFRKKPLDREPFDAKTSAYESNDLINVSDKTQSTNLVEKDVLNSQKQMNLEFKVIPEMANNLKEHGQVLNNCDIIGNANNSEELGLENENIPSENTLNNDCETPISQVNIEPKDTHSSFEHAFNKVTGSNKNDDSNAAHEQVTSPMTKTNSIKEHSEMDNLIPFKESNKITPKEIKHTDEDKLSLNHFKDESELNDMSLDKEEDTNVGKPEKLKIDSLSTLKKVCEVDKLSISLRAFRSEVKRETTSVERDGDVTKIVSLIKVEDCSNEVGICDESNDQNNLNASGSKRKIEELSEMEEDSISLRTKRNKRNISGMEIIDECIDDDYGLMEDSSLHANDEESGPNAIIIGEAFTINEEQMKEFDASSDESCMPMNIKTEIEIENLPCDFDKEEDTTTLCNEIENVPCGFGKEDGKQICNGEFLETEVKQRSKKSAKTRNSAPIKIKIKKPRRSAHLNKVKAKKKKRPEPPKKKSQAEILPPEKLYLELPSFLQELASIDPSLVVWRERVNEEGKRIRVTCITFHETVLDWALTETLLSAAENTKILRTKLKIKGRSNNLFPNDFDESVRELHPVGLGPGFPFSMPVARPEGPASENEIQLPFPLEQLSLLCPATIGLRNISEGSKLIPIQAIMFAEEPLEWAFKETFLSTFEDSPILSDLLGLTSTTKKWPDVAEEILSHEGVDFSFPFACPNVKRRCENFLFNDLSSSLPLTLLHETLEMPVLRNDLERRLCGERDSLVRLLAVASFYKHISCTPTVRSNRKLSVSHSSLVTSFRPLIISQANNYALVIKEAREKLLKGITCQDSSIIPAMIEGPIQGKRNYIYSNIHRLEAAVAKDPNNKLQYI